jgi:26S proteasome regulatory subunit N7
MAEPEAVRDSRLELAEKIFLLRSEGVPGVDKAALQKEVLDAVTKDDLLPIYDHCCATLGWPVDQAKRAAMKAKNDEKMAELESKIKDAEENLGEQEVRDGLLAKADFLGSLGDKDGAATAYEAAEKKSTGSGAKMDLAFSQIRCVCVRGVPADRSPFDEQGARRAQNRWVLGGGTWRIDARRRYLLGKARPPA